MLKETMKAYLDGYKDEVKILEDLWRRGKTLPEAIAFLKEHIATLGETKILETPASDFVAEQSAVGALSNILVHLRLLSDAPTGYDFSYMTDGPEKEGLIQACEEGEKVLHRVRR